MPTMDQVSWANANVTVAGDTVPYGRGALLPEPTSPEEAAERSTLRLIGAVRTVEVVYTPEELADQARARGQTSAAREAALDVDPAAPSGQQMAGREPGPPTMVEPSGAPVVIGDEDLKAEHEQAQQDAQQKAGQREQARQQQPSAGASKKDWVEYAVLRGADRGQAESMSRDQLVAQNRDTGGQGQLTAGPPTAMDQQAQAQAADQQEPRAAQARPGKGTTG